ncbi:MAG: hypothetical protein HY348_02465 [Nitrospira defluvii]|nr:hypothetical protein [Nitrospira defluvii]
MVLFALSALAPGAWADDLCPDKADKNRANEQFKQAEELERGGRARDAYSAAEKVNSDCLANYPAWDTLKKRLAKTLAGEEEKKSRFPEAFDWYERAHSIADAGRMQRKLVEAKPDDLNTVANAIEYFARQQDSAQEQAMRAHALKNVEKALAAEDRQFASATRDSMPSLDLAMNWARQAKTGESHVRERAEKRGDSAAMEDGRSFLEKALTYYRFAEKPDKEKKVRDKARTLAERAASKGEGARAAGYYNIAGDSEKASATITQHEAQAQQAEEARKKSFKKDQDKLEKELGF